MSSPIEDYALIGDGQTAALVNRNGSIDWLCWPQFDSDACFCALLGTVENGRWSIAPAARVISTLRRYREDTLIIETDLVTETGSVRLIDFMPMREKRFSSVVRIMVGLSGSVAMHMDLRMRFDYGALPPWCEAQEDGLIAKIGPGRVTLHAPLPVDMQAHCTQADFVVAEGQRLAFVLSYSVSTHPAPPSIDADAVLRATQTYWRSWIGRFDERRTMWPSVVKRSLITLRAMANLDTGGLIAAPTTSLPEMPGGSMNWD